LTKLEHFCAADFDLSVTHSGLTAIRKGRRTIFSDKYKGYSFGKHLSGQLVYHYRPVDGIIADFSSRVSALEAVLALASSIPDSPSFQNSHCGEILAAHFIEERLGFRRLYSKLTLLTSQNTNAHKMDGLFVDTKNFPYTYLFVEAKSSILPTVSTPRKSHRSGILTDMIRSLEVYAQDDPRFEFSRIRDNLEKEFSPEERKIIQADLTPPGPDTLRYFGVSITNKDTVNYEDDDFILSKECHLSFDYHGLVVTDLAMLAEEAYGYWSKAKQALN
jgi:hypothetical protein